MDDNFYNRADEHINLSNSQLSNTTPGKVSASMMYSVARFNAWLTFTGFNNAEDMKQRNQENIEYFVENYRKMLIENMEDYIENFKHYSDKE